MRANGGHVTKGNDYIVGEKEAERFTAGQSGRITPMSDIKNNNVARGVTININGAQNPDLIMNKVVQALATQGITR
jgi:hypothetical protein